MVILVGLALLGFAFGFFTVNKGLLDYPLPIMIVLIFFFCGIWIPPSPARKNKPLLLTVIYII